MDPVALQLGPLVVRWYGLAYVAGFVAVWLVLRLLAKRGLTRIPGAEAMDFVTYAAVFGVLLGGRVGYALFYDQSLLWPQPWRVFAVWDGGMASHGGVLGVMAFTLWYAWKKNISWTHVGDSLVIGAPLGILFGRSANFINGELYGRVAPSLPWAVKFPDELIRGDLPAETTRQAWHAVARHSPDLGPGDPAGFLAQLRVDESLREVVGEFLQPRHPSQIYEGVLEGLVLFILLFAMRLRFPRMFDGVLTSVFFIGYGVFRVVVEMFREPDSALILGMTKGQFYSIGMIIIGVLFLANSIIRRRCSLDAPPAHGAPPAADPPASSPS